METIVGKAFEFVDEYRDHERVKVIYFVTGIDYATHSYIGKRIDASGSRSKIEDWSRDIDVLDDSILHGIVYELHSDYPQIVRVELASGQIRKVPKGSLLVYKKGKEHPIWIEAYLDTERGRKEAEKMAKRRKAEILTIQ